MLRRVIFDTGGGTRPLNRILEAAKIRREPVWALGEQNERGLYIHVYEVHVHEMHAHEMHVCKVQLTCECV
jgi:hypothetical protein